MKCQIGVTVNGELLQLDADSTVKDLLTRLNIKHSAVAVEINAEIIPHQQIPVRQVNDGEIVEVVSLVGGG